MTFFKPDTRPATGSKYLKIISGIPSVIQIMDEKPIAVMKHWFTDGSGRRIGIRCPGPEVCPVCIRNRQINFNRDHPDFISPQKRYRVNVLELTPVKRCGECGAVYSATAAPQHCSADGCGTDLSEVVKEPLKEVKILERGPSLMDQFAALEKIDHPFTGKQEALQSYPIMLVATGKGKNMVITAIPQVPSDEDIDAYEKLDLNTGLILTSEEIQFLLEGGVYKDIVAARRAETETKGVEETSKEIPF